MKDKKKTTDLPPTAPGITVEYAEKNSPVFYGERIEKLEESSKWIGIRLFALEKSVECIREGLSSVERSAEVYYRVKEGNEKELKRDMLKKSILVSVISWVIAIALICLLDSCLPD